MDNEPKRPGTPRTLFVACLIIAVSLLGGCSHFYQGLLAGPTFEEANEFFRQGSYQASLGKYEQILAEYPTAGDRVLFEMGILYAYPSNEQKDYQKALDCFEKLLKDYPESKYRQDSVEMISHIHTVTVKNQTILEQQRRIETLERELKSREEEIHSLRKKIEALEQKVFSSREGPAEKILIKKKERRLMLISKGKVLKTYRIALGGNPDGPKVKLGDHKTPEGTYIIDARNKDSRYHLSLHISYPNEKDRRRARALGVDPGGSIMIHGLKNGFSWVGALHSEVDWTKGCIAVTDEEIEEIASLVPNGTAVDIRP